jgi:hypothetical protein
MLYYRLYFLNAAHHIASFIELDATDDEEAIAQARAHGGPQPLGFCAVAEKLPVLSLTSWLPSNYLSDVSGAVLERRVQAKVRAVPLSGKYHAAKSFFEPHLCC